MEQLWDPERKWRRGLLDWPEEWRPLPTLSLAKSRGGVEEARGTRDAVHGGQRPGTQTSVGKEGEKMASLEGQMANI